MTNTLNMNQKSIKNLDVGKKVQQMLKVKKKVGQKLHSYVKTITYTLKSNFKSHLPGEHSSQTFSSKPTFSE